MGKFEKFQVAFELTVINPSVLVYPQDLHERLLLRHLEQARGPGPAAGRTGRLRGPRRLCGGAGFTRNAHYLVRPDGHVALCEPAMDPMPWLTTSATAPTGVSATDATRPA